MYLLTIKFYFLLNHISLVNAFENECISLGPMRIATIEKLSNLIKSHSGHSKKTI